MDAQRQASQILQQLLAGEESAESTRQALGGMGFTNQPAAAACCRLLLKRLADPAASAAIVAESAASYAPTMCLNNWARLVEKADRELLDEVVAAPAQIARVSLLFSFSQSLSSQVIASPERLAYLLAPETLELAYGQGQCDRPLREYVAARPPDFDERHAIVSFKQREMLRIALRDLSGLAPLPATAGEIAYLAGAIVRLSLQLCRERLEAVHGAPQYVDEHGAVRTASFAVIAMGKLGGRELNVSSDLDVVFVYDQEGETAGVGPSEKPQKSIGNHQFFTRLAENLVDFLMSHGGGELLYRIDTRLRPEGAGGPLVRSLESYENYLLTQARLWEKMALIKARGIAGERQLLQQFETMARLFVYEANPPQPLLREVLRLKDRIDREVYRKGFERREVKRGYGGIREIEFQVGVLQLIHGKQNIPLRRRATLHALDALKQAGLIPPRQYEELVEGYRWLRTVEHRLQYLYEQQAHLLPESPEQLEALARRCGMTPGEHEEESPTSGAGLGERFLQHHQRLLERVHYWFTDTFAGAEEPADSKEPDAPTPTEVDTEIWDLLHQELNPEQAAAILAKYNFQEPHAAIKTIRRMVYGASDRYVTAEGQQFFERIFPRFMAECGASARPDQALRHFESFFFKSGGVTAYYRFIVDYPLVLRMLSKIFGASDFLAKILIRHPEYLDLMVAAETLGQNVDPAARQDEVMTNALRARAEEVALNRVRRFHQQELLKIGERFLLGLANAVETARSLSDLARVEFEIAYRYSLAAAEKKHGACCAERAEELPAFTILGLGKLGARELTFFSDLDVVYVYDGEGRTAGEAPLDNHVFFAHVAEGIHDFFGHPTVEGRLPVIDTRLRPEGKSGPLVVSRRRFEAYFGGEEAQPWEYQAYLRLGCVGGSTALFSEIRDFYRQRAISLRDRLDLKQALREMRGRLEESVELPSWAACDFKRGPGGLVDIEFLVQYLQLAHAAEFPELLVGEAGASPSAPQILGLAAEEGWLEQEDAEQLQEAYRVLRTLEMMARLIYESPADLLPRSPERLKPLRIALQQQEVDLDRIADHAGVIRRVFEKFFS